MVSSRMTSLRKTEDCPSSQRLLEFQKSDLRRASAVDICIHLACCEFCAAEVEFYSYYPQADASVETPETAEIPAPLYELAEALLKNRHGDSRSLNSLLRENGELILDGIH